MNKLAKKSVIVAALCLVALCCFIAVQGPTVDTNGNSAPTHKVTICYTDPDTQEVLSSETVLVADGGMFFTADEARAEELCTLTIQPLNSDGQEDGPAEIVPLPVGATYAVNVPYNVSAPDPDPIPELPTPPAAPTSATATAETDKAYTLTVTYRDLDGSILAPSETKEVKAGEPYKVSAVSDGSQSATAD